MIVSGKVDALSSGRGRRRDRCSFLQQVVPRSRTRDSYSLPKEILRKELRALIGIIVFQIGEEIGGKKYENVIGKDK